jgi:hypothetical protein
MIKFASGDYTLHILTCQRRLIKMDPFRIQFEFQSKSAGFPSNATICSADSLLIQESLRLAQHKYCDNHLQ